MASWLVSVRRDASPPRLFVDNRCGFRRSWSGRTAHRLCRSLGLASGRYDCPKDCVWRLFLLAQVLENHGVLDNHGALDNHEALGNHENLETSGTMESNTGESDMMNEHAAASLPASNAFEPPPTGDNELYWNRRLRDHGLLPTRPRRMIARRILGVARHFTAEELMRELREAGCRCARATVYNTLNEFAEQGLLRPLHVDAGPVVYDTVTTPHAHLYNLDTGELTDLAGHEAWLRALPELPPGLSLESVQLVFQVRDTTPDTEPDTEVVSPS